MISRRVVALRAGCAFVLTSGLLAGNVVLAAQGNATGPALVGAEGEFTALSPTRILDTRSGTGGVVGPLGRGPTAVQVTGRGGVPAGNVSAVVLNVTVTGPTAASYLAVWPSGAPRPVVSNLNYVAGQTVPNQVTVMVGSDGKVQLYNHTGTAHVIFDVSGYYSGAGGPRGSRWRHHDPERVVDTRSGLGGVSGPLGRGPTRVQVINQAMVAKDDTSRLLSSVRAVTLNVTVTAPTASSYLSVWPDGQAQPTASSLNYVAGQTVANLITVPTSADGRILLYNHSGTAHVIVDLISYYVDTFGTDHELAGRFIPVSPRRILDTKNRIGTYVSAHCSPRDPYVPVTPPDTYCPPEDDWTDVVSLQFGYNHDEAPSGTRPVAAVMNMTVIDATAHGFLQTIEGDMKPSTISNLNYLPGRPVSNAVASGGKGWSFMPDVAANQFAVSAGSVHVIADLFGYFIMPQRG